MTPPRRPRVRTIVVLSRLGPRLMRVDVAAACCELQAQMGAVSTEPDVGSSYVSSSCCLHRAGRPGRQDRP
jgi:hypothetical protein